MEKNSKRGITLIALIITVIIMLILAGVSISILTDTGGLFQKVEKSKEIYAVSGEKEAIKLSILNSMLDNINEYNIGIKLYDRTITNGNKWNIIYISENQNIYGTGWYYLPINTNLPNYGTTKNNWLVNYNSGEVIQLISNSYTELSYASTIGVTDNLIFNIDSSIIANTDQSTITTQLGENVELMNFDWNENSGLTTSSFNLDGVDDYIKIRYDNVDEKQILKENGFTFEFYGIATPGRSYDAINNVELNNDPIHSYRGLFCYWNGNEQKQANLRVGITDSKYIQWNAGMAQNIISDFSQTRYPWNNVYLFNEGLYNKELYFTITLDVTHPYERDGETYYPQSFYINGTKFLEGGYNKRQWDSFIQDSNINSLIYFCIGRSSMTNHGEWHYTKMNTYATRLYNRALNAEEVLSNYNTSVAYHELITQ